MKVCSLATVKRVLVPGSTRETYYPSRLDSNTTAVGFILIITLQHSMIERFWKR